MNLFDDSKYIQFKAPARKHRTNSVRQANSGRVQEGERAVARQLPRGLADLGDQLTRAARSSCLAIAEGANARSVRIKRTYFERATASNGECAACFDQVVDDDAAPAVLVARGSEQLERATRLTLGLVRRS